MGQAEELTAALKVMSLAAARMAPRIMTPQDPAAPRVMGWPYRRHSPVMITTLVRFLKIVTIGTFKYTRLGVRGHARQHAREPGFDLLHLIVGRSPVRRTAPPAWAHATPAQRPPT
jgi:hypothetical protein